MHSQYAWCTILIKKWQCEVKKRKLHCNCQVAHPENYLQYLKNPESELMQDFLTFLHGNNSMSYLSLGIIEICWHCNNSVFHRCSQIALYKYQIITVKLQYSCEMCLVTCKLISLLMLILNIHHLKQDSIS